MKNISQEEFARQIDAILSHVRETSNHAIDIAARLTEIERRLGVIDSLETKEGLNFSDGKNRGGRN